jgi:hypothetical protein
MTGGSGFNGDLRYGVISRGLIERGGDGVDRDVAGVVVMLRPLLEMGEVSLGEGHPRIGLRI